MVLLDAGDLFQGTMTSNLGEGQAVIDAFNLMGYAASAIGNHEFDFGPENFAEKMKASKYPWAAINITKDDGSPVEGLGGVTVREVGGLKVALIPLAQDTSPEVASTGSLKFLPTVDTAIAAAEIDRAADEARSAPAAVEAAAVPSAMTAVPSMCGSSGGRKCSRAKGYGRSACENEFAQHDDLLVFEAG